MQKKLTLIFIVFALIPLLLVLEWTVAYLQPKQVSTQAQLAAQQIRGSLEHELSLRMRDIESFVLTQKTLQTDQQQNYINEFVKAYPEYKLIMFVDTHGIVRATNTQTAAGDPLDTANLQGKSFEQSTWFRRALALQRGFVETPRTFGYMRELYVDQNLKTMPVVQTVQNNDGQVTGVWVLLCDTQHLSVMLDNVAKHIKVPGRYTIYDNLDQTLAELDQTKDQPESQYEMAAETIDVGGYTWTVKTYLPTDGLMDYLNRYFWPVATAFGLMLLYAFITARRIAIPLQRLVSEAANLSTGKNSSDMPYQYRQDEYGALARALQNLTRGNARESSRSSKRTSALPSQPTTTKIDETIQLVNGLSAQANMLALNASMEAVKSHHLDTVAEQANELAQKTSYNSQELLRKLAEIKSVCEEIQEPKGKKSKRS